MKPVVLLAIFCIVLGDGCVAHSSRLRLVAGAPPVFLLLGAGQHQLGFVEGESRAKGPRPTCGPTLGLIEELTARF